MFNNINYRHVKLPSKRNGFAIKGLIGCYALLICLLVGQTQFYSPNKPSETMMSELSTSSSNG